MFQRKEHEIPIGGLPFCRDRRVFVVLNGKKVDEGIVRQIGFADGGPAENRQISLVSEALGGREAIFGYYEDEKCWHLLFQNSVGSAIELSYKGCYQLEAFGS